MKVVSIVGARPQFVKTAPVSRALRHRGVAEVLLHTGQHFDDDMAKVFFEELEIPPPDHALGIHGGTHGAMTGRMLEAVERVLLAEAPAAVVVYGDTNSTLAGALAATKLRIPVVHVEAGLRSWNRAMPEEINRVVTDHLSRLLLCPTLAAVQNLGAEGITDGVVHVGDVMYDATLWSSARSERSAILETLGVHAGGYSVVTIHRAENTDDPQRLAELLSYLAAQPGPLVWPVHPRARQSIERHGLDTSGLTLCGPLGHLDMTKLVRDSVAVYTDSGGLQKEAYFLGVPCVTLREETEWVETVAHGWNRLWTQPEYAPRRPIDEYGDGHAAEGVAEAVVSLLAS